MVVIDFIDMVLEANRDLVLRRLTEALGRDRTRHQGVGGHVARAGPADPKALGTGLIEAFSTPARIAPDVGSCCTSIPSTRLRSAGRGPDTGGGGRRGKRGKKGVKTEDVQVAKVPSHAAGEHPIFKAMAAANGRPEDEDEDDSTGGRDGNRRVRPGGRHRRAGPDEDSTESEDDRIG